MRSLISEFSYGFALTHELVSALGTLSAAPVFPSLLEEGREGGGYDVKLESPGVPFFLQFKRSECLQRRSAKEIKAGASLDIPFYRMTITGKRDSDQHDMLLELDTSPNVVCYAAPMFHQKSEFDDAFLTGVVRQRSFYVRPSDVGAFSDDKSHSVAFDGSRGFVMSEPRAIKSYGISELEQLMRSKLEKEKRPFRAILPEALQEAESAQTRGRERVMQKHVPSEGIEYIPMPTFSSDTPLLTSAEEFRQRQERSVVPARVPILPDDPALASVQRLADIGLRDFNAQLYIVQEAD